MDESGTINPAALNANSANTIAPSLLTQASPRGIKRGRSDDADAHGLLTIDEDLKSNKRSKPYDNDFTSRSQHMLAPVQTPQIKPESLSQSSPNQSSPQRTPGSATKPAVVKALPTVRDHTTDQLNDERDEYIYREVDQDGETKVSKDGYPMDNRKYKCRTFQVPKRGEKLFMLATECARVLGYRDSYLLFNKNRSLYKIIANQEEKDNLIHQEILPYSYRSRQIAIVTARSMFRQFGSRLIENGRRVRDDYWEAKARKQGFTEEDAAGEKRPGAAKAREAQAAADASHASALTSMPQNEIIYNTNGLDGQPPGLMHQQNLAPLPMIHLASDDLRSGFGSVIRPRQEIAGAPYQDRTQSSTGAEIMTQANSAAEWNKQLAGTRQHRTQYLDEYWRRPHEQPVQTTTQPEEVGTVAPQNLTSPQAMTTGGAQRMQHDQMSHSGSQMLSQMYSGYSNAQNPMASPVQGMHRSLPPGQMHQGSPGMPGAARQGQAYGYQSGQMWQQQPQASSMSQMPQYGQQQQQHHSQMSLPQMAGQPGMGYAGQMNMANPAYAGMNRGLYQPSPNPQQFNMQQNAGQQQGMQGWSQPGNMSQYGQGF
ncbi:hypothetical protein AMS68_007726 [Peltaster fructicola]|uniref:Uncharacterized protein n=1 Tax=Peltaster fructicola TaxID=286661 RepID=A0A6H0Y5V6_9PEZI|nr:hypothetical protein AMS68_007726 [Peltaster fructicola]